MPQPYKLFTIYAREDAQYLEELRGQLRPLEHAGRIKVWSDREINPGVDWEKEIVQNLDSADIILIFVSAAYYNSAYIHEKEIKHAIGRHERGEAKVLPVIVRPCSFLDDPVISRLQVLPTDGKPVTSQHWRERDDAWLDVVAGVKKTIELMQQAERQREEDAIRKKENENRAREEAGRREQEAIERAENERLAAEARRAKEAEAQLRREQEQEHLAALAAEARRAKEAEHTAWRFAADTHDIPAYENYLARYPQGEYAREARFRIKELKRKEAAPLPLKRYAVIGGGALALLLAVWLVSKMFGDGDPQLSVPNTQDQLSQSSPQTNRKSGLEMVLVQGGAFTMGSPTSEAGRDDDECQHSVPVGSFSIGKYEVTQADWRDIMGSDPPELYNKGCDQCPVERVSWNDIQDFLKKLNARYPGKNYRLPTEEEWEYAARGGSKSKGYVYAGSNNLGDVAWYGDNYKTGSTYGVQKTTRPVGGKSPNELVLFDMSGNVWEWCQDTYKPYSCDSKNTAEGSARVIRGGGWNDGARYCRAAYRNRDTPTGRSLDLGFRLAASSF